jgi:hypothetical protein
LIIVPSSQVQASINAHFLNKLTTFNFNFHSRANAIPV